MLSSFATDRIIYQRRNIGIFVASVSFSFIFFRGADEINRVKDQRTERNGSCHQTSKQANEGEKTRASEKNRKSHNLYANER